MSSLRPFHPLDLLRFNLANLDVLTETYDISFYLSYMAKWPTLMSVMESSRGKIMGYIMGKAEGTSKDWHGHVTAVTVAPDYRRLGLAKTMMDELERVTTSVYNGYFVDLYVRVSNDVAIRMYEGMGYSVYRTVVEYYSSGIGTIVGGGGGKGRGKEAEAGDEDAYDMRKPMRRDKHRRSVRENGREVKVLPHEVW
ncbi:acyl-CoA N-acyltransferase [Choiromyces venosus 120613-1]|uniref:Acyl-CoA N-acyltransferase n=1 Tax=Choiromyces venosus 120613-1 TaxID=1336337 RepID=A0A3N4K2G8_9PEZI|nr:acyl-CoA N-acyltransferase [Choiromyces venosus 120613-1]